MRKKLMAIMALWIGVLSSDAQMPLKFRTDGKFKIVQFTDVHYIKGDVRSDVALENIRETLDSENPDFVIFTGDLIFGKPAEGMNDVLNIVSKRKIPFAYTFGNHDDEQGMTRTQLFEMTKGIPYNVTATTEGLTGITNFILPIQSAKSDKPAFVMYVFDSNSYSQVKGVNGYDYIHHDQISWYRANSTIYTENNNGMPIPSIAFFHIPIPEYNQAASDEAALFIGARTEKACAPALNTGLFSSIKEMGDVMATFVGHDHNDDYAVLWHNVLLVYGRYSGGNTVYNDLKPNGARIIELTEGEQGFRTWVRLRGGATLYDIQYPDFFKRE